jgi:hypothetical protein
MENNNSYVDLPAIIAGTSVALAISVVLANFGAAIGLAITPDASWEQDSVVGKVITINLWVLWVQILSSLIGGYIAGRMRAPIAGSNLHEREMRDGVHGLSVWAVGTVLVAVGAALVAALAAADPNADANQTAEILRMNEHVAIIVAFSVAAGALISALASWWAATKGGEHRDEATDLSRYVSFRK